MTSASVLQVHVNAVCISHPTGGVVPLATAEEALDSLLTMASAAVVAVFLPIMMVQVCCTMTNDHVTVTVTVNSTMESMTSSVMTYTTR